MERKSKTLDIQYLEVISSEPVLDGGKPKEEQPGLEDRVRDGIGRTLEMFGGPKFLPREVRQAARILGARGGRKGGSRGGQARMATLTPEQRRELAQKAATARWGKPKQGA